MTEMLRAAPWFLQKCDEHITVKMSKSDRDFVEKLAKRFECSRSEIIRTFIREQEIKYEKMI